MANVSSISYLDLSVSGLQCYHPWTSLYSNIIAAAYFIIAQTSQYKYNLCHHFSRVPCHRAGAVLPASMVSTEDIRTSTLPSSGSRLAERLALAGDFKSRISIINMIGHTTQPGLDRTFHFFSRLPAELRWKIWELNLPSPRLISIRCGSNDLGCPSPSASDGHGRHSPFRTLSSSPPGCTSPARIPANLHTCHEARREAFRYYQPAFGIAHQPGQIFFSPLSDILYFGPRDGFMAAEAQLRTVLTLCNPEELARVEKVAINDAVFWTPYSPHSNSSSSTAAAAGGQRMVASSLLVDVLRLFRERMPGLRELVFVPRDENPLYSGDACLVEPTMAQSRLARVVREAMGVVFCQADTGQGRPWDWKIMTLSADADVPVYGRQVLGWEASAADENVTYGNAHGPGYRRDRAGNLKGREFARLSVLQESVRRQFMQMEMGAVPVLVE